MKLLFLILLSPALLPGMSHYDYFLLDERVHDAAYYSARLKFDSLNRVRKSEIDPQFSIPSPKNFNKYFINAIRTGAINSVIKLFNVQGVFCRNYFLSSAECNGADNAIDACLYAMNLAKQLENTRMGSYRIAESAMLMALVLDNINNATITKSQIHRAWKLNPHVSRMMALARKHPDQADDIIGAQKQLIREIFTRKLAR